MTSTHSTRWFWSDWAGDVAVRRLTPAERGMWIDLLALAAVAQPTGYVCDERGNPLSYEEIGRFANCSPTDAESLIVGILAKGAASRDRTGRIWNRRMVRDVALSVKRQQAGRSGAAATKQKWLAFSGLPGNLPGDLPQQTGTRAFPKEKTKTFSGAAREAPPGNTSASNGAEAPSGLRKEVAAAVVPSSTSYLVEALNNRGRVR